MSDFITLAAPATPIAPWREPLARSLHRNRNRPHSRYFQLATVQPNGHPANRTVVFRGFWPGGNQLTFVTDCRSQKVAHLAVNPWAEVCWYFTQTREQFRLGGPVLLIGENTPDTTHHLARQQAWAALSEASRCSFYWPPPGRPLAAETACALDTPQRPEPPSNFCLGQLDPNWVEHLDLTGHPQHRTRYTVTANGPWQVQRLNP